MARNLKQINNAENHLIVGSIEVLGDISNSGMKQIKKNVRSLQDSMTAYVGQTTDYWSKLSDDGIITPLEKTLLKKEWETIAQTYTTVMVEAVAQQVTNSREIIAYQAAYNDLRYYLNTTLALFDEMSMDTEISDREEFNEYFATYYQWENLVQVALAVGKIGSLDFTVVDNLDFEGTDDQVVIYKGELYQWIHNQWKKIGTNGYMGALASFPTEMEGNFFLCTQSFTANVYLKTPEGYNLLSPNDEVICIPQLIEVSYIYAFESGHWNKIADTTDYRYIVAMGDYYNLTGELPAIWQNELDNIDESLTDILTRLGYTEDDISTLLGTMTAAEIHALIEQYGDDIEGLQTELDKKLEHIPAYLGLISATSNIPTADKEHAGNWFLWNSNTTSMSGLLLYKGYVYKCTKASGYDVYSWQSLNPADTTNSSYYMSCLDDLLKQEDVIGTQTFNTIFANAFFSNAASISALQTQQIELSSGGFIKSAGYIAGGDTKGFLLKSDGTFECVDGTFKGTLSAASGTIQDITGTNLDISGNSKFAGILDCGQLQVLKKTNWTTVKNIAAGNSIYAYVYLYFRDLGVDPGTSYYTIADLFSNYSLVKAYYGDTQITNVRLNSYDQTRPFSAFFYEIYFNNGDILISDNTEDPQFLANNIKIQVANGETLTFMLFNLPNEKPDESNMVYCKSDGILRLS